MVECESETERTETLQHNNVILSYTERSIWDMWRRWRMSNRTLWPWMYATDKVYADDLINLETLENMVVKLEKEQEELMRQVEESRIKDRV
jgi:hypothetical protein